MSDIELREQAYRRPDAIIAYSVNGKPWPGYYIPLAKHITLERELADAIRERDNALSDWRQADTDSIRAIHERNEARAEVERLDVAGIHSCHDNCPRYACTLRRERDALADALREIILADSLNDARAIAREALTKLKP
jgi:hypothetical protein